MRPRYFGDPSPGDANPLRNLGRRERDDLVLAGRDGGEHGRVEDAFANDSIAHDVVDTVSVAAGCPQVDLSPEETGIGVDHQRPDPLADVEQEPVRAIRAGLPLVHRPYVSVPSTSGYAVIVSNPAFGTPR
jgi:hypothetical protein